MAYNVLELVKEKEKGYFEAEPGVFFPVTIRRIQEVLGGEAPVEIVSPGWKGNPFRDKVVDQFLREAEKMPAEAWELALVSAGKVKEAQAELRAEALAFAESWFKRALALAVGQAVRLHMVKNLDWRR